MTRAFRIRNVVAVLAAVVSSAVFAQAVVHANPDDRYVPPSSPLVRERLEWFQDQKHVNIF